MNRRTKQIFFCLDCGQTHFTIRKPAKCKYCKKNKFNRILTQEDLRLIGRR